MSVAALPYNKSWETVIEVIYVPQNLKYLWSGPLKEWFADSSCRQTSSFMTLQIVKVLSQIYFPRGSMNQGDSKGSGVKFGLSPALPLTNSTT